MQLFYRKMHDNIAVKFLVSDPLKVVISVLRSIRQEKRGSGMTETEMDHRIEDRLEACEVALAHVTKVNEDLSDIVAQQQVTIGKLLKRVEMLLTREAEREAQGGEYVADQRPPHW